MKKYLLLFLSILIINACKTVEKSTTTNTGSGSEAATLEKVHDSHVVFEYLSVKFSASLPDISLNGQLKIQRNNTIWISMNKFIEVVRLKATKDSLFFVNRLENTYYAGDYKLFEKLLGVNINYNMLEALLLGNDFECFDNINYKSSNSQNNTIFQFAERTWNQSCSKNSKAPIFANTLSVDNKTFRINSNSVSTNKYNIEFLYPDFQEVEKATFPLSIVIKLMTSGETQNAKIVYDKPSLGKIDSFPFSVPKNAKSIY